MSRQIEVSTIHCLAFQALYAEFLHHENLNVSEIIEELPASLFVYILHQYTHPSPRNPTIESSITHTTELHRSVSPSLPLSLSLSPEAYAIISIPTPNEPNYKQNHLHLTVLTSKAPYIIDSKGGNESSGDGLGRYIDEK